MKTPIEPADPRDEKAPAVDSLGGLFLIMFAKGVGYATLLVLALIMLRRAHWSLSAADVFFWLCAVAIPIARHRASARFGNAGAAAPPLEREVVRGRYRGSLARGILVHIGIAAVLWTGAHSIHFK